MPSNFPRKELTQLSRDFKGSRYKYGIEIGDADLKTGITYLSQLKYFTPTFSPVAVAVNTTAEQTFTVAGLEVGDTVLSINKPTAQAGLGIVNYRVSAKDTLAVTFVNDTAGIITPTASEVYKIVVGTLA